jgi:uncharacterized OB-fold protein
MADGLRRSTREGAAMSLEILSIDRARAYPPRVTAFTQRFWDSVAQGRLETTMCDDCGRFSFPPKSFCPHCWSTRTHWAELSGRGRLYSQTMIHAAPATFREEAPYRVGIVDLEEGLRVATRILAETTPPLDVQVRIVTLLYTDGPLFAARPCP